MPLVALPTATPLATGADSLGHPVLVKVLFPAGLLTGPVGLGAQSILLKPVFVAVALATGHAALGAPTYGSRNNAFAAAALATGAVGYTSSVLFVFATGIIRLGAVPLSSLPAWLGSPYMPATLRAADLFTGAVGFGEADWVNILGTTDPINPGINMQAGSELIYQAASGMERALAQVEAFRLTATYAELVSDQWDPQRISYRNLPYLAWAVGVNLWEDDWSEEFKRWWVANQWTLKYQRGSLLGATNFVQAVGGTVRRAIVPPNKFHPTQSYTQTQRAAFVSRFQQLRIYPYVARIQLPYLCFPGKWPNDPVTRSKVHNLNGCFVGPMRKFYPTTTDAGGLYTRFATLYDPQTGVETPLTMRVIVQEDMGTYGVVTWDEVMMPGHKSSKYYMHQPNKWFLPYKHPTSQDPRSIFLGVLDATSGLLVRIPRDGSLDLSQYKAQYQTIKPGLQPINVYPEHVYTAHSFNKAELYPSASELSSQGLQARGSITFNGVPLPGYTLVLNGSTWTFVAENASGNKTNIQTTVVATVTQLAADLNASTDVGISGMTYRAAPTAVNTPGITEYMLILVAADSGVLGNAISIDVSGVGGMAVASGATLTGGTGSDVKVTGKQFLTRKYMPPSDGWKYTYERWYLFDPTRLPAYRKGSVYMGVARFGMPKYTAELDIEMPGQWRRWFMRCNGFMRGFHRPADLSRINKLRRAVTASMAARDTIRINTAIKRVISSNDSLPLDGSFSIGQYIDG